jgi:hypothetical protein
MRFGARVPHVCATEFVLVSADTWVRSRSIWLPELAAWDLRELGPELLNSVEIEAEVEVHADTQSRRVDSEEPTQPRTEESHHFRIAVGEVDLTVALAPFTRI